jgi:four helix bundle protein
MAEIGIASEDSFPLSVDELNSLLEPLRVSENRVPYGSQRKGFRDLVIYREALQFVASCYEVSRSFPREELYGLTSQFRRAAISITANIAEGWGRNGKKEFARFTDISIGSLCEADCLTDVAGMLKYMNPADQHDMQERARIVGAMLFKLRASLKE